MRWFLRKLCRHEFDYMRDMASSNIPVPDGEGYYPGSDLMLKHPAHTHRVFCRCHKCGEWFFSDCGLHLPGKLVQLNTDPDQ